MLFIIVNELFVYSSISLRSDGQIVQFELVSAADFAINLKKPSDDHIKMLINLKKVTEILSVGRKRIFLKRNLLK